MLHIGAKLSGCSFAESHKYYYTEHLYIPIKAQLFVVFFNNITYWMILKKRNIFHKYYSRIQYHT